MRYEFILTSFNNGVVQKLQGISPQTSIRFGRLIVEVVTMSYESATKRKRALIEIKLEDKGPDEGFILRAELYIVSSNPETKHLEMTNCLKGKSSRPEDHEMEKENMKKSAAKKSELIEPLLQRCCELGIHEVEILDETAPPPANKSKRNIVCPRP